MSIPLTKQITEHFSKEKCCFSFFCDCCGKEWRSRQTRFEPMDGTDEVVKLLWAEKYRVSFEQANLEARLHFNLCPLCGRWVCDDCFRAEEIRHGGICTECEERSEKLARTG